MRVWGGCGWQDGMTGLKSLIMVAGECNLSRFHTSEVCQNNSFTPIHFWLISFKVYVFLSFLSGIYLQWTNPTQPPTQPPKNWNPYAYDIHYADSHYADSDCVEYDAIASYACFCLTTGGGAIPVRFRHFLSLRVAINVLV